jgi:hypothetical protein
MSTHIMLGTITSYVDAYVVNNVNSMVGVKITTTYSKNIVHFKIEMPC